MKTFLKQIANTAKAWCQKFGFSKSQKDKAGKFNPAPSYWALVPVRPQEYLPSGKNKNHD